MPKILLNANTDWYLYNFRLSLIKQLTADGVEVVVVSPQGRYVERLRAEGLHHVTWEVGRQTLSPWKEFPALLALLNIYRRERPDLVHHFTIKPVIYGSIAGRLARVPAMVNSITGRGYVFLGEDRLARFLRPIVLGLYRLSFSHPNQAVTFENQADLSYFINARLIKNNQALLVDGAGVDVDHFIPLPEPGGTPVVVLAARLLWDKGVGDLVDAARILKNRVPVRVALVGEPDPGNPSTISEDIIHSWVEEGVVEWWGWQEDMCSVYERCHIVVLPSYYEGVPRALLEAAACARPIVATDIPGCRDLVHEGVNGFLVPTHNPEALASALEKLIRDRSLRQRMGAAGRELTVNQFSHKQVNEAFIGVYHRLLGNVL
jgi:glycosyltransferase involved in cell wall biosynthesis